MYNTKQINILLNVLKIIIVVLGIFSIFISAYAKYYYEEYNRVQGELAELAQKNQELEEEIISKDEINNSLETEISYLKTEPKVKYVSYSVPFGYNSFRSWMPSTAISPTSKQGRMISTASPDKDGLMKINDCYCVALGTYYGNLGDVFQVTTSSGTVFRVIKTDTKADAHTDSLHQYTTSNSCMMEFIVNIGSLNSSIKFAGSVNTDIISGSIIKIEKEIY